MSEAIVGAVLSAIITGAFTLIGKRMEVRQSSAGGATSASPVTGAAAQPAAGAINYGRVLIHVGILQLVLNLVGFFVGLAVGPDLATLLLSILIVGTIVLSAGFFLAALSINRAVRWKHFSLVAVGVAITTLIINSILLQTPISTGNMIIALVQTFVCMGIGVGLANRVRP